MKNNFYALAAGVLITLVQQEDWALHLSPPAGYAIKETKKEGLTTTYLLITE